MNRTARLIIAIGVPLLMFVWQWWAPFMPYGLTWQWHTVTALLDIPLFGGWIVWFLRTTHPDTYKGGE